MAYLRDITRECAECGKPATVRLITVRNDELAPYCKRHGEAARRIQQRHEDESYERAQKAARG